MAEATFDIQIRVLSCERCGAPLRVGEAGGTIRCEYCGTQMVVGRRQLASARTAHALHGDARIAKLRMDTGRPLPDNPYSTVRPPPGCEALTRSAQVLEPLGQRFREALALVRAQRSFEHERLLWWCATMLNQGYGMLGKHIERRGVLERAIEEIHDPGFRHLLYVNLAGAAARAGELGAAWRWMELCDPEAEDLVLDSGYRIGLASVLVREGDAARILEVVGAAANVVPEAHQYRLMFALYRAHAHELLGASQAAMAAAMALRGDPEVGPVFAEALRMNGLAPATAAALDAGAGLGAGPGVGHGVAQSYAPQGTRPPRPSSEDQTKKMVIIAVAGVVGSMMLMMLALAGVLLFSAGSP